MLRLMVRTPHTRVMGVQEVIQEVQAAILVPDMDTRAMDLLRGRQEVQEAILATGLLTPAVDLLQVVPRPPLTPCCKTEVRGFLAAMKEVRLLHQERPLAPLEGVTLAGGTRATRTTEDR